MADLDETLLASALETLDIGDYWPTNDEDEPVDLDEENDGEYPILLYFYENLFDQVMRCYEVDESQVKQAFKRLKTNYKRLLSSDNVDYDLLSNCCGYLHLYAACHAGLVRKSLLRVFHVSPPAAVRRLLSLKSDLQVVSLGGGPGNCMLGLCSALYGKHFGLSSLSLTVVDSMAGWSFVLQDTEHMLRKGDFGCLSKMFEELRVSTSFIHEDLIGGPWSSEVASRVAGADVVMLVKTLSVLREDQQTRLLVDVSSRMKPGALLVYVDSPFPEAGFQAVAKFLDPVCHEAKSRFRFQYGVVRFCYTNITHSTAQVRIYAKKFYAAP